MYIFKLVLWNRIKGRGLKNRSDVWMVHKFQILWINQLILKNNLRNKENNCEERWNLPYLQIVVNLYYFNLSQKYVLFFRF